MMFQISIAMRAAPPGVARVYLAAMAKSFRLADLPSEAAERSLRRHLVVPGERGGDLAVVAGDTRLRSWLRKDFMDRRYRGTAAYLAAARRFRTHPDALPGLRDVRRVFRLDGWDFKNRDPAAEDARRLALEARGTDSTEALDYGDVLELCGCAVAGRSEFNAYCEGRGPRTSGAAVMRAIVCVEESFRAHRRPFGGRRSPSLGARPTSETRRLSKES